jgi:branched-chain amino acid transport system substrate-binding protein
LAIALTSASAQAPSSKEPPTIKIGNTMPYSGPASPFSVVGKAEAAYIKMINEKGGVNGRRIEFISYDDGYSPPKAVEQVRRLVENDEVLAVFSSLGTASNVAIQHYLNTRKVPQLFLASGAARWNDPGKFPWSMPWSPDYLTEGAIYAKYARRKSQPARSLFCIKTMTMAGISCEASRSAWVQPTRP